MGTCSPMGSASTAQQNWDLQVWQRSGNVSLTDKPVPGPSGDCTGSFAVPQTVTNPGCPGKHGVLGAPQPSCSLPCHCQLVSPAQQHTWDTLHLPNLRVWVGLPNRHRPHTVPRVPWMCRWPQGSTQRPRAHARPLCPHQRRYGSEREMPRRWSQALLFSVNH